MNKNFQTTSDYCIILPDNNAYQWILGIEFACHLVESKQSVTIMHLVIPNIDFFKSKIKHFFGYSEINKKVLARLEDFGVTFKNLYTFPNLLNLKLTRRNVNKFSHELQISNAHISNELYTEKYTIENPVHRRVMTKHVKDVYYTIKILNKIDFSKHTKCITPNGRFSRNRAIKKFLDEKGKTIKLIDSNGNGRFEIMDFGQSMMEHTKKIDDYWSSYYSANKVSIASSFFLKKASALSKKQHAWSASFDDTILPEFPKKKMCVFYTTTQMEMIDDVYARPAIQFSSQNIALQETYRWLKSNNWHLVVRRHPYKTKGDLRLEEDLWDDQLDLGDSTIISGASRIDSYRLAEKADLIATYGSTIGAEFIFKNEKPVISLGYTPWYLYDRENHFFDSITLNNTNPSNIRIVKPEVVLPMALYALCGGTPHKYVVQNLEGRWEFDKNYIYIGFRSWIKMRVNQISHKLIFRFRDIDNI